MCGFLWMYICTLQYKNSIAILHGIKMFASVFFVIDDCRLLLLLLGLWKHSWSNTVLQDSTEIET